MRVGIAWVGVGAGALLVAIAIPVFTPARNSNHRTNLGKVKVLGLTVIQYAADEDDRLPPRDTWMDATYPYAKSWDLYHCPLLSQGKWGYAFNAALDRARWRERAGTVPMVYDSVDPAKNTSDRVTSLPNPGRYAGKNDIVYEDGHARRVAP